MKAYSFFTKAAYLLPHKKVHAPEPMGPITVMSYNIRFKNDDRDRGKCHWYARAKYILKEIASLEPDLLCLQEVRPVQNAFFDKHLVGYGKVFAYRDDSEDSESCPIYFNAARFTLVDSGTFWLSETPDVMSKSWDSWHCRIATYATLKDMDGTLFTIYNNHPDYRIEETRINQLAVLADRIRKNENKVIVAGDFNAAKGERCLKPFEEMLRDSKDFRGDVFGATFNEFGKVAADDVTQGIDFLYLPKDCTLVDTGVLKETFHGIYPSDHFPIYATILF